ncbi:hypothetical protein ACROYT_G007293 [Oculina patagonica]
MSRHLFDLLLSLVVIILVQQEYHTSAGKDLYVSRHYGNDSHDCGSKKAPCRTLARGIQIADQNDRILLDGQFTKSDPYNCGMIQLDRKGENHTININVSLEITGYPSAPAYISCYDLLDFTGPSWRKEEMKVNFTGIVFTNTSMLFIDSNVSFVNCSFLQSLNPVQLKLFHKQSATAIVKSSLFSGNTASIRVEMSKNNAQVTIELNNVNFTRNKPFSEDEGSGISIYSTLRTIMLNVSTNVFCKKTTFSNNVVPLITNNVTFSETNEFYQDVKFIKTSVPLNALSEKSLYVSKGRDVVVVFDHLVSTGNAANIRCVQFNSSTVQLKVLNSQINGHTLAVNRSAGAGILIQSVRSSHVLMKNSSFKGNTAAYQGGAVAFNAVGGVINVTVWKTNFTNNFAPYGGAFSINSQNGIVFLEQVSFRNCRSNHTGGALFIIINRHVEFRASFCSWVSGATQLGSSIYIAPFKARQTNATVKLEKCKFINNTDMFGGTVFVLSTVGSVEVFQTEWSQSSRAFAMVCNCRVNFTEVSVTGCTGTAFRGWSSERNRGGMSLYFQRCLFLANKDGGIYVSSESRYFQLTLESIKFLGKKNVKPKEYNALLVKVYKDVTLGSKIVLHNVVIEQFVGSTSMILKVMPENNATNSFTIKDCTFRQIRSYYSEKYHTETSPLSIVMPDDNLNHNNICSRSYLSYQYRNTIVIENTSFVDNIGRVSGVVYLVNGNVTLRNCTFENNFAINRGGHVHIADGSGSVRVENCVFKQKSQEMVFTGETFIHDTSIYSESTGQLLLQGTRVTTDMEKDSYRLFAVTKAGVVKFDNSTKLQCAVGSSLRFDNFSHFILWPSKPPCKLKVTVITLSCHQCFPGLYSLERGEVTAPLQKREDSFFNPFCLACPDGANCSRNIEAKPNFWGYPESNDPPSLKFVHCPPHYCKPADRRDTNLSIYNSCYGNRDGVMCGKCMTGYTETMFSKKCKPNEKCKDPWIWFLMIIYTMAMALFFIHNPPIIQFLVDNTLWCKKTSHNRTEYQEIDRQNEYNKGYTKITFYFYQIASYLTLEPFTEVAKQAHFVSFFIGLFNFQTRISRGHFGCPFPGLTVVTKELIPALGVLATLFNIQLILLIHLSFNKIRGRPRPSVAPYYAATLKTLLLGYATTANTALKLLTCVHVLGESRLYYDANIKCLTWWQYFFIVYVVACLLPFIAVIYWGAVKLQRELISVEHFIAACFFPLGFISFWLIQKLVRSQHRRPRAGPSESSVEVLKVLHDPFRLPSPRQFGSLYWESVMIGRRFLLLSFQVFFPDPLLRLFFMDMTCLLVFTWHVVTKPFRDQKANVIEAMSLACLVVIATINLIQAIFLSAGVTPQGSVVRSLTILQQVEIYLLGIAPLLLVLLCGFAIVSQVARVFVTVFRKTFRFVLMRRIRVMGQY